MHQSRTSIGDWTYQTRRSDPLCCFILHEGSRLCCLQAHSPVLTDISQGNPSIAQAQRREDDRQIGMYSVAPALSSKPASGPWPSRVDREHEWLTTCVMSAVPFPRVVSTRRERRHRICSALAPCRPRPYSTVAVLIGSAVTLLLNGISPDGWPWISSRSFQQASDLSRQYQTALTGYRYIHVSSTLACPRSRVPPVYIGRSTATSCPPHPSSME